MINQERLVNAFCELVKIDSPSDEEEDVARHLTERLTELGFSVARDAHGNVIASEDGADPLMLSAHMDTVEPGRSIKPQVDGDIIRSDGTTILGGDCKAGVAAILEALESAKEDDSPRRPVQVVFTRGEEIGLVGAANLDYSMIRCKEAVVFDGNGPVNTITGASPTYMKFDVTVTGRGAHAGVEPEKGLSAIRIATEIINELPNGRLDEESTFNVGLISGGTVRNAFVARDCGTDPLLLSLDYSQIELRVLAHMSGDTGLRRSFDEGLDIHASTASRVFSVALDEVTTEMRRRAKVFNCGVLYGLTAFGLSQREGIPRDEAESFITSYFEAYPAVAAWRDAIVEEARARGYAETLTGRRRYVPDLRASNRNRRQAAERVAINMPIQGTAADIIKIAMNRIDAELLALRRTGKLARMVLQVHDELIFELPREELDAVREIAHRLMPSIELDVPLELAEKWGRTWGELR